MTLHYLREDHQVRFVKGMSIKGLVAMQQMRAKVLKLRRLQRVRALRP